MRMPFSIQKVIYFSIANYPWEHSGCHLGKAKTLAFLIFWNCGSRPWEHQGCQKSIEKEKKGIVFHFSKMRNTLEFIGQTKGSKYIKNP